MTDAKKTLYADPSQSRFYLIPDDAGLPAGELALRSLTGAKLEVAAASAEAFRIDEAQAKELAREAIGKATRAASSFVAGLGGMLQEASKRAKDPTHETGPGPREPKVAEALGVSEDELRNDPDAVIDGLKRVGQGLQQSLKEILSSKPGADSATKERLAQLGAAVGWDPEAAGASVDDLKEKLRGLLANPELEERIQAATERLRAMSEELRAKPKGTGAPDDDAA